MEWNFQKTEALLSLSKLEFFSVYDLYCHVFVDMNRTQEYSMLMTDLRSYVCVGSKRFSNFKKYTITRFNKSTLFIIKIM